MPKKASSVARLKTVLAGLNEDVPEDLHLPSLRNGRLEGFAALFIVVLPLFDSEGQAVFTGALLDELFLCLDARFGGCLTPSARSHAPFWGLWNPTGGDRKTEKDYVTTIQIFANPIEPTNRFFTRLKEILKTAGSIEQQEILIARFDCWLV